MYNGIILECLVIGILTAAGALGLYVLITNRRNMKNGRRANDKDSDHF
jgi:hypothetical protein